MPYLPINEPHLQNYGFENKNYAPDIIFDFSASLLTSLNIRNYSEHLSYQHWTVQHLALLHLCCGYNNNLDNPMTFFFPKKAHPGHKSITSANTYGLYVFWKITAFIFLCCCSCMCLWFKIIVSIIQVIICFNLMGNLFSVRAFPLNRWISRNTFCS